MARRFAIIGKLMSGKTTVANYLVDEHGFTRIALADALKEQGLEMLNLALRLNKVDQLTITREMLEQDKEHFRVFLQWYGTDFWRVYMEQNEHWINVLRDKVASMPDADLVIDDVRFPNEVDAVRDMGFTIIKLLRDETSRRDAIDEKYIWSKTRVLGDQLEAQLDAQAITQIEAMDRMERETAALKQKVESILAHPSEALVETLDAHHEIMGLSFDHLRQIAWLTANGYYPRPDPTLTHLGTTIQFGVVDAENELVLPTAFSVVGIGPGPIAQEAA